MAKEELIKRACYIIDTVEDILMAVESDKPAESLPLYNSSRLPEPEADTKAILTKSLGKARFMELAFNTAEKFYRIGHLMQNEKFEKYGRGTDWFQRNNYDCFYWDILGTFTELYTITKQELHKPKAKEAAK